MGTQAYLNGKELEHPHEIHEHVSPKPLYLKILTALLFLTILTVLVSEADLGAASLSVAMMVAVVKASLVVGYFMHLKYDDRYHLFIFISTLICCLFLVLVIIGQFATTRNLPGLVTMIAAQALINMGSTLHLIPTKGMTLPFISYGGSSLLATAFATGMLLALTRKGSDHGGLP